MTQHIEPIEVVAYNPDWPRWFDAERDRLLQVLGVVAVRIDHIGSTAVPGLAAKPVIDILAIVEPFPLPPALIAGVESLDYEFKGEYGIVGRQYFRTRPHARHLHVFAPGSLEVGRHLLFRDYLRSHPEAAREYGTLKRRLAAEHRRNREAYTDGKAGLVRAILERAGAEATTERS
ncbi:MAG: GrpB family protein [Dehalococcoidia bacterium]